MQGRENELQESLEEIVKGYAEFVRNANAQNEFMVAENRRNSKALWVLMVALAAQIVIGVAAVLMRM